MVINGFQNGIADDPYSGISDMRNVNIISIPREASVNFSTSKVSYPTITNATVQSSDAAADTITFLSQTTLEARMSIVFSATTIGGLSAGTIYWVGAVAGATTCQLFTDQALSVLVNITSNSTGTFSTLNPTKLLNWAYDSVHGFDYAIDSTGYVWGTNLATPTGYWTFAGNTTVTNAGGRGLVCYTTSNNTCYLFVFRNKRIDYALSGSPSSWVYGWNTATGGAGVDIMETPSGTSNSHQALVGQDNVVYFCDASYIGSFFEKAGQIFDPTSTATFTAATSTNGTSYALKLPFIEKAQCLAELGVNLLVGGIRNQIYPWDRISTSFKYPILLAENNIFGMVTVNTNTFIFVGNRGRIYITNGTNGQLYKKVPDHLSGTVEPYFTWGGACSIKNQLYFGLQATTNAGAANNNYGGVWAIDLDSKAIRLTNQLSYATYAGVASIVFPIFSASPAGTGLYIGWFDGSTYGIDQTSSTPYSNYESYIDTDNIPIGSFLEPRTFQNVQWKLSTPLVSGEGVKVWYRKDFSQSFTLIWEKLYDSAATTFSDLSSVNFEKAQWVQIRVQIKSTASSPSYTRLTEIRLI